MRYIREGSLLNISGKPPSLSQGIRPARGGVMGQFKADPEGTFLLLFVSLFIHMGNLHTFYQILYSKAVHSLSPLEVCGRGAPFRMQLLARFASCLH